MSVWSGDFVARTLGVHILNDPASALPVTDLVGLALRRNPKRAHLLVSQVLAKHVPTEPALVMAAGHLLGAFVAHDAGTRLGGAAAAPAGVAEQTQLGRAAALLTAALRGVPGRRREELAALTRQVGELHSQLPDAVVIGYAETATGLGRLVANQLGAYYIHSTRTITPGSASAAGFEEGHSHATSHAMVPADGAWLNRPGPVVLVDDEFSTGATIINTIRELHALVPHEEYLVAALIDLRSEADRARMDALAAELGARISVTALGTGHIELAPGILADAAALIASLPDTPAQPAGAPARLTMLECSGAELAPVRSDRYGNAEPPAAGHIAAIARCVAAQFAELGAAGPVTVVGCEENMFTPLAVAGALAELLPETDVRFSTTTRSPIVPVDRPDYAIAAALTFASHAPSNDGPGVRFAYNLSGGGQRAGTIVVCPEPGTARREITHSSVPELPPLVAALGTAADDLIVLLLPADAPAAVTA